VDTTLADPTKPRWDITNPRYRVTLWSPDGGHEDWDLADVGEVTAVLEWARNRTPVGGRHDVHVLLDHESFGLGLINLAAGTGPAEKTGRSTAA
jgi:hypothetical protein